MREREIEAGAGSVDGHSIILRSIEELEQGSQEPDEGRGGGARRFIRRFFGAQAQVPPPPRANAGLIQSLVEISERSTAAAEDLELRGALGVASDDWGVVYNASSQIGATRKDDQLTPQESLEILHAAAADALTGNSMSFQGVDKWAEQHKKLRRRKGNLKPEDLSRQARCTPTAPGRDQPVSGGRIKLDFSYRLSPLRREVVEKGCFWAKSGKEVKITRFNESGLMRWGWLLMMGGEGTIFTHALFFWTQLTVLLVIAFGTALITYAFQSGLAPLGAGMNWMNFDHKDIAEVYEVLDEIQGVASVSEMVTTLVAFILGLYVSKTVDIWWEIRHGQLQTILNTLDSMCLRMAIYFPGKSKEDMEAKEQVLRYGALSIKLLFKEAREIDAWTVEDRLTSGCDNLLDLEKEGLLTREERQLLTHCPCRSQVVWVWLASYITKLCLDGRMPDPLRNQEYFLSEAIQARNAIANVLARINTQFPLSYTHLVVFMVKLLLFVHSVVAGYILGLAYITGYFYWGAVQVSYLIIWTLFHQGLIQIKEHISNPFRDNRSDFSGQMLTARSVNQSSNLFAAASAPPYGKAAALPPQLIVRQMFGGRMRPRGDHNSHTQTGPEYNTSAPATPPHPSGRSPYDSAFRTPR